MNRLKYAVFIAAILLQTPALARNVCNSEDLFKKVLTEVRDESSWLRVLARAPATEREEMIEFLRELDRNPWRTPEQDVYRHLAAHMLSRPGQGLADAVVPTRTIRQTLEWFRGEIQPLNPELAARVARMLESTNTRYGDYVDLIADCADAFERRAVARADLLDMGLVSGVDDVNLREGLLNPGSIYLIPVPTHRNQGYRSWSLGAEPAQFVDATTRADDVNFSPRGYPIHDVAHTQVRTRALARPPTRDGSAMSPLQIIREHNIIATAIERLRLRNPEAAELAELYYFWITHERLVSYDVRSFFYRAIDRHEAGTRVVFEGDRTGQRISDGELTVFINRMMREIHETDENMDRLNTPANRRALQQFVRDLRRIPHPTYRSRINTPPATSAH